MTRHRSCLLTLLPAGLFFSKTEMFNPAKNSNMKAATLHAVLAVATAYAYFAI
jgi:hypothetical protein